ncbi:MAG: hypothetical protein FWH20_10005, partial [Oscillospiraceae bacterium]|nr:hypothetical protein [Oscillospiraceae bacterium]
SDVCGGLCGGLFGAYRGLSAIPKGWLKKIQYRNLLADFMEELYSVTVFRNRRKKRPPGQVAQGAQSAQGEAVQSKAASSLGRDDAVFPDGFE